MLPVDKEEEATVSDATHATHRRVVIRHDASPMAANDSPSLPSKVENVEGDVHSRPESRSTQSSTQENGERAKKHKSKKAHKEHKKKKKHKREKSPPSTGSSKRRYYESDDDALEKPPATLTTDVKPSTSATSPKRLKLNCHSADRLLASDTTSGQWFHFERIKLSSRDCCRGED